MKTNFTNKTEKELQVLLSKSNWLCALSVSMSPAAMSEMSKRAEPCEKTSRGIQTIFSANKNCIKIPEKVSTKKLKPKNKLK